jgi:N,N'-diacetyllegionaminate synthase
MQRVGHAQAWPVPAEFLSRRKSRMSRTFIIAEVGVNHNANLDMALQLIDVTIAAGADAIKFQTAIPELVATGFAQKAGYQKKMSCADESQLEMIRKIHFPLEVYPVLKAACEQKGIMFFSTAFDMTSLAFLESLGQDLHKVPSGEITNLPYLRAIGSYGRPVILSTGMATMEEIVAALDVLEQEGTPRSRITVLHCNTEYPTPMQDVNLRAMCSIRDAFGVEVGYSDHTLGIEVPIAAVALGATVIEKHLTLDRNLPGPDHMASLEPDEFAAMVSGIRNIEQAIGDGIKRPSASESKNKPIARKSLTAAKQIRAGEQFTPENVTAKRPGTGVSPMRWDEVIGKVAARDFAADDLISL